jgi:purine-nucleoside phosphorylase
MATMKQMIEEAVAFIRTRTESTPPVGIILGTGLGGLAQDIEREVVIPYQQIPHFPVSTVESHAGQLLFGALGNKQVMAMQGRFHYYEGYTMAQLTFPVRVMKALGVGVLFVSNASGGLNPLFRSGDVMLITDHINLLGDNPLIGPNDDTLGLRFPDMYGCYDPGFVALAERVALQERIPIQKGVFVAVSGPNLETGAEYRFLRIIGGDAVGMSTVPEVIVARHQGTRVLGFSVVTDMGLPDALKPTNIADVIAIASKAEPNLTRLMKATLEELAL